MTYRQIISDIRQYFSGGIIDNNFRLSTRRILSEINNTRARILYEDLKKRRPVSDFDKQYICIELEEVDGNVCGIGPDSPCTVQRSICPIPRIIDNRIYDISSVDGIGSVNFDYLKANEIKYKTRSRSKAEREGVYVFMINEGSDNYLYVVNNPFLAGFKLQGLFEDPLEAFKFKDCDDPQPICSPLDEDFPLNERLIPLLKQLTVQYLASSMGISQDIFNNEIEDQSTNAVPKT